LSGVKKGMKIKKVTTMVQVIAGALATVVFLVMAFKINDGWALLLVGSFALVCLGPAFAPMWFRAFGARNTSNKNKGNPPDD